MNDMRNPYMSGRQESCGCRTAEKRNISNVPFSTAGRGMYPAERVGEMRKTAAPQTVQKQSCNKSCYMADVYELGFVMVETALYLDTHPDDAEALEFYADMKQQYAKAVHLYNENVGPLNFYHVANENYWNWVKTPMPWEMEG